MPVAGETPSGQHPYFVSLQVSGTGHPSSNGPIAAVLLSEQHPYLLLRHSGAFFGLGLHFRGVCSLVIIASNVFGVVSHKSVSVSDSDVSDDSDVLDHKSVVVSLSSVDMLVLSTVDSVDPDTSVDDSVDSVELNDVLSEESVDSVSVDPIVDASVVELSMVSVDSNNSFLVDSVDDCSEDDDKSVLLLDNEDDVISCVLDSEVPSDVEVEASESK